MLQFQVEGMSCAHCVKAVTQAVQSAYPQASVDINLDTGVVRVEHADDAARVAQLIEDAGYTVSRTGASG
ncbi:MAG: heavy-metal-associated domain-containing protein [Pigmentiphaga sp.]|uniref:heavy-metal-associated domain-containing protein n=1 Tax=Pigmentiphaga sp. TaxID=1977564 RepID=UPI0029B7FEFD|nr:heavy-metal-associated domain-containing protein [Pigmentiphaga sp.]MDX3904408.1 heavy-metal-associated domain-containing protein [Pigmentiphaga sp.]